MTKQPISFNSHASYYQDDMFDFAISRTHLVDFHGPRQIYRFLSTRIFREHRLFHRGTVENKQKKWIKDTNLNWSFSNMYTPNCFDYLVSIYVESIQHPTPTPPVVHSPPVSRMACQGTHREWRYFCHQGVECFGWKLGAFRRFGDSGTWAVSHHFFRGHHGKLTWNLEAENGGPLGRGDSY